MNRVRADSVLVLSPSLLQKVPRYVACASTSAGSSLPKLVADSHAQVIILDFNIKPLEGKTLSEAIKVVQGDVSSPESWKEALKVALDAFGKLTIVCNNAGICTDSIVG